jgi:hypothetical protein
LAKFDILFQLGVNVPDLFVFMPHPKTLEVLWNGVLTDVGEAKTPESMRSAPRLIENCQNWMQPTSQDIRLAERFAGS